MGANLDLLVADLQRDEGWRGVLYDDKTGKPIRPGSIVEGHPTIGYGFALDVAPLTQDEGDFILRRRAQQRIADVQNYLPWSSSAPESVQRALTNMAYNLGIHGLLGFAAFLTLLAQGKYAEAANDLKTTLWAAQVRDRAIRIEGLIRNPS